MPIRRIQWQNVRPLHRCKIRRFSQVINATGFQYRSIAAMTVSAAKLNRRIRMHGGLVSISMAALTTC